MLELLRSTMSRRRSSRLFVPSMYATLSQIALAATAETRGEIQSFEWISETCERMGTSIALLR